MAIFSDLYSTRLDRELGSLDTQLFTAARRKAAINEAQQEFVRLTGCLTREAQVSLSDGDDEVDLEAVITDDDFIELTKDGVQLKQVSGSNTRYIAGDDLPRRDIPWLDRHMPGWRSAADSTPTAHYLREDGGLTLLGLTPPLAISGSDTWTLIVPYIALPEDMVDDADEPFTVDANAKRTLRSWHQGLVHFAAARLELLRKNYPAYDRQMQLFNTYVTDYLQKQRRKGGQHVLFARDYLGEVSGGDRVATADWFFR